MICERLSALIVTLRSNMITRKTIYGQIEEERKRQDDRNDFMHGRKSWRRMLRDYVERTMNARGDNWRQRLIVIAAVCVAAIEAHDRWQEQNPEA